MSLYKDRTAEMLQIHGLRRTEGRIAVLQELATATRPLSIEYLQKKLSKDLNLANLYRSLGAFGDYGIVTRITLDSGRTFYELSHEKPHHHHITCEVCGIIEDIPAQDSPQLTQSALKYAPRFSNISRHSLEFYGRCKKCTV